MAIISDQNKTNELAELLRILFVAPGHGMTIDQIQAATGWENARVHHRLLNLGSQVGNAKLRRKGEEKATYYFLKDQ